MCEPATLTTLAIGTTILAAGASAYGAYQQQQSQNAAADYTSKMAKYEADDAVARGKIEAKAKRLEVARMISSQRAGFGASGAVVDAGSALATTEDTARFGELDALAIEQNAKRAAWQKKGEGNLARMSKSSSMLALGTSLASSGSALASRYG